MSPRARLAPPASVFAEKRARSQHAPAVGGRACASKHSHTHALFPPHQTPPSLPRGLPRLARPHLLPPYTHATPRRGLAAAATPPGGGGSGAAVAVAGGGGNVVDTELAVEAEKSYISVRIVWGCGGRE